jgi:parallel beta-helix repeat protein
VGPRTVNSPGTGISFNSSGSLQAAIDANPSGSTFVCSTNTPTWDSEVNTGTKAPTIIFPGILGQCIIDCGFGDRMGIVCGNNTTIRGGTWQNLGTTYAFANMFHIVGTAVTITDVVAHHAFEKGLAIQGPNAIISHARFHTNGRYGLNGGNAGDGALLEYCEIDNNNTRNLTGGDDAAGTKFSNLTNGTFRYSYVHDNHGFGFWPDTGCNDWMVEENVMEGNHFSGLMYEANAASVLRHNYVSNNGNWTSGVGATPSTFENNVNVRLSDDNCTGTRGQFQNNLIDHTLPQTGQAGGLFLLWDHSGTVARSAQNWDIHDNQFWLRGTNDQRVGGLESGAGFNAFPVWSSGNSFFSNEYRVASMSVSYWKWDTANGAGVATNYATWQGYHPGDNNPRVQI